jgi:hypothetical protein
MEDPCFQGEKNSIDWEVWFVWFLFRWSDLSLDEKSVTDAPPPFENIKQEHLLTNFMYDVKPNKEKIQRLVESNRKARRIKLFVSSTFRYGTFC